MILYRAATVFLVIVWFSLMVGLFSNVNKVMDHREQQQYEDLLELREQRILQQLEQLKYQPGE